MIILLPHHLELRFKTYLLVRISTLTGFSTYLLFARLEPEATPGFHAFCKQYVHEERLSWSYFLDVVRCYVRKEGSRYDHPMDVSR